MTLLGQGGLANSSGRTLETTVIGTLESKGFRTLQYREWMRNPAIYGTELLLRNVPYTTLYGHPGKTEFLIRSQRYNLNVRVECKWQQSSGSVDEKFPYLYLNCIECMPEQHIIILIDGGGAKPGSVAWLRNAVANKRYTDSTNSNKTISVMNLSEFLIWANRTCR
jgi:hypothetical protein